MATNIQKEGVANMSYDEIKTWHEQYPKIRMKENLATYVLWEGGLFMGAGDFFHKQPGGSYQYSHTVDYGDPHEYPETVSGDSEESPPGDFIDPGNPDPAADIESESESSEGSEDSGDSGDSGDSDDSGGE
jgi:hypothetical protein